MYCETRKKGRSNFAQERRERETCIRFIYKHVWCDISCLYLLGRESDCLFSLDLLKVHTLVKVSLQAASEQVAVFSLSTHNRTVFKILRDTWIGNERERRQRRLMKRRNESKRVWWMTLMVIWWSLRSLSSSSSSHFFHWLSHSLFHSCFNWLAPSLATLDTARVSLWLQVSKVNITSYFALVYLLSSSWNVFSSLLSSNWIAVIISFIIIACNLECVTRSQL